MDPISVSSPIFGSDQDIFEEYQADGHMQQLCPPVLGEGRQVSADFWMKVMRKTDPVPDWDGQRDTRTFPGTSPDHSALHKLILFIALLNKICSLSHTHEWGDL